MSGKKRVGFGAAVGAYFSDFGARQICDILLIIGMIVLIVGIFTTSIVATIGAGIYVVASGIAVVRSVLVLTSGINKRSPEFKRAVTGAIVMGLIFLLAIFAFIYSIVA
jgi:hypothetical protein